MFTGIVEEIGAVRRLSRVGRGYSLSVQARTVLGETKPGDSIAVNGVCLTVTHLTGHSFTVGLSPETRERTNLLHLAAGVPVNLERSLTPHSRLGGHFVQGHVDGVGVIASLRREEDALWITVQAPDTLLRYIVPQGYVALDGVSLTVVTVTNSHFVVQLVAYTQQQITLSRQPVGYVLNIEVDVLGKYVEKLLTYRRQPELPTSLTPDFLAAHGFTG